jgi:hypothetical protein
MPGPFRYVSSALSLSRLIQEHKTDTGQDQAVSAFTVDGGRVRTKSDMLDNLDDPHKDQTYPENCIHAIHHYCLPLRDGGKDLL